ncbi:hypothetical protein SAMN05421777_10847 [Fluoribacter gormanii]|uniref:Uncharacterized protein n=1 Tax=Fluoribacter gormanii TaxID=464 RepID=A0A377GKT3_9GAMM|nr:hypothetical protein SAMN05421777_10847 [Fluoribacter gormanii]STO25427.1 Uncharacterised protein [Fluoribacter gormanii]
MTELRILFNKEIGFFVSPQQVCTIMYIVEYKIGGKGYELS